MKLGKILFAMMAAFLLSMLIVGGCAYSGYNKAISLDEDVKGAWAQVENQLQRRFDLIPNIVETVKGYAGHEKDVFTSLAKSREAYGKASTVGQKVKSAGMFESALSRIMILREAYPELKANQVFQGLQVTLEGTENRLAVERKRYNDQVKILNTFSRKLLGQLYCSFAGVEKAEYFEVADVAKTAPKVDFGNASGG